MAPAWAQADGFQVREVTGERMYRCPGCQQEIRPGTIHLVVVPDHDPGLRRHWHTPCWRRERQANP
jgi:tRNA(Ile2) C34 agmatinyltransferase TiaS